MAFEQLLSQDEGGTDPRDLIPNDLVSLVRSLALLGLAPDTSWQHLYHRASSLLLPQCTLRDLSLLSYSTLYFGLEPSSEWMSRLLSESQFKMQAQLEVPSEALRDPASLTRLGFFVGTAYKSNSSNCSLDSGRRYKPLSQSWFQCYMASSLASIDNASPDLIAVQMTTVAGLGFLPPTAWKVQALTALSLSLDDDLSPSGLVASLAALSALVGSQSSDAQKGGEGLDPDEARMDMDQVERSFVSACLAAAYKRREDFSLSELTTLLDEVHPRISFAMDGKYATGEDAIARRNVTDIPSYVSLSFSRTVAMKREEERVRVRKAALEEERWKKGVATGSSSRPPLSHIHIESLSPGEVLVHSLIAQCSSH